MPITISMPYRNDVVVEDWCIQNLPDDGRLRVRCVIDSMHTVQTFYFEDEIDAMAFKLRWM